MRACLLFVEQKSFESRQNAVKSHLLNRLLCSVLFTFFFAYCSLSKREYF